MIFFPPIGIDFPFVSYAACTEILRFAQNDASGGKGRRWCWEIGASLKKKVLNIDRPFGRRVLKFDSPSG
jgi:hypothetical protein